MAWHCERRPGGGGGSHAGRRWPTCGCICLARAPAYWRKEEDDREGGGGGLGRPLVPPGCSAHKLGQLVVPGKWPGTSLSLFPNLVSVFYCSVVFRALLKILRHFQKS